MLSSLRPVGPDGWNRHRGLKDHADHCTGLNVFTVLAVRDVYLVPAPVRPSNCFLDQFEGPCQQAYFPASLSNEIAVAREAVMTRSSPAFKGDCSTFGLFAFVVSTDPSAPFIVTVPVCASTYLPLKQQRSDAPRPQRQGLPPAFAVTTPSTAPSEPTGICQPSFSGR